MAPTSIEFIQAVWDHLEATGPTDFARKLGLGVDGLQKIRRWRQGGRLDYEDVMKMLEVTGWFTFGQPSTLHPVPRGPVPLEELAENDAELLANQAEALRLLREMCEKLELQRAGSRTETKHRRGTGR